MIHYITILFMFCLLLYTMPFYEAYPSSRISIFLIILTFYDPIFALLIPRLFNFSVLLQSDRVANLQFP
jgi:RsiW-degrading membrane proteinase PrsW (M82 family)